MRISLAQALLPRARPAAPSEPARCRRREAQATAAGHRDFTGPRRSRLPMQPSAALPVAVPGTPGAHVRRVALPR